MLRGADKWLMGYVKSCVRRPRAVEGLRHLFFCVADHFEPLAGGRVSRDQALACITRWSAGYQACWDAFRDADGQPPRHTFFYPQEDYDEEILERLAGVCRAAAGEIEVHLHHRQDTAAGLATKLVRFRDILTERHGLLGREAGGRPRYGFVHGNWALCNSRPDGDWCGVNEELGVLVQTGCYADFTFPSAPSPTQPRLVNQIYRAVDSGRPRAADWGMEVGMRGAGARGQCGGDGLMLVQGPLALAWNRRKWGVLPRLENGEISGANPPTEYRTDLWVKQCLHVRGRPDWVFAKVHTHGARAENMDVLLGLAMPAMHRHLRAQYNDGQRWCLHYVSARELYNVIRAAEDGVRNWSPALRNYEITPPPTLS